MSKHKKNSNKVVRDMKECFQSLDLPIVNGKKEDSYDFMSNVDNNNLLARIYIEYQVAFEYVNINFSLGNIPSDKITEMLKMINLINGTNHFHQYSICPCCNEILAHSQLFIPGNNLPKDKFNWLIRDLLESANILYPLMGITLFKGGDLDKYYGIYRDTMRESRSCGNGLSEEMEEKVLKDLVSVFADFTIAVSDENSIKHGYYIESTHPEDIELLFRIGTRLDTENRIVIISGAPGLIVPDEKMAVMMELINRINRLLGSQHLFIDPEDKRTILLTGILLENGILRKEEFRKAFEMMTMSVLCWFPIFKEMVTSGGISAELIRKRIPCYKDQTTMH